MWQFLLALAHTRIKDVCLVFLHQKNDEQLLNICLHLGTHGRRPRHCSLRSYFGKLKKITTRNYLVHDNSTPPCDMYQVLQDSVQLKICTPSSVQYILLRRNARPKYKGTCCISEVCVYMCANEYAKQYLVNNVPLNATAVITTSVAPSGMI